MAEASLLRIIFIKWTWKAIYKARVVFVWALRWERKGANSIISSSLTERGGVVSEFSLPLLKINCLFLSLIFGSAVMVLPIPHRPFPVSLLYRGFSLSCVLTSCSFWATVCVTTGTPGWKLRGTCLRCFSFRLDANFRLPSDFLFYQLSGP